MPRELDEKTIGERTARFRSKLKTFSREEFEFGMAPYLHLSKVTRNYPVLRSQFEEDLVRFAVRETGADKDKVREQLIEIMGVLGHGGKADYILEKIHMAEQQSLFAHSRGKPSVMIAPIMCGIGKSYAISLRIRELLQDNKSNHGMLVVTDSKQRLHEYVELPAGRDDELARFFDQHRQEICILDGDSIEYAREEAPHKRVLLMTTQRFMHLTDAEKLYYTCSADGEPFRSLVIIDEAPLLYEMVSIDRKTLSDVMVALKQGIPARGDIEGSKKWALGVWSRVTSTLEYNITADEQAFHGQKRMMDYADSRIPCDPEEVESFLEFIRKYKADINRSCDDDDYEDIVAMAETVLSLTDHGSLFVSRVDRDNTKGTYTVIRDNTSRLEFIDPTAVVILDGTADIDPRYSLRNDLFCMMNTRDCRRHLRNLRIHYFDHPSGVTMLRTMDGEKKAMFISEITQALEKYRSGSSEDKSPAIFTFRRLERDFARIFGRKHVEHLGNIKGRNDFRDLFRIAQIGVMHTDESKYITYRLLQDDVLRDKLLAAETYDAQTAVIMEEMNNRESETNKLLSALLLCDMEQNMFRGRIRNLTDNRPYHFLVCFSKKHYPLLYQMIHERYERFGAKVTDEEFTLSYDLFTYIRRGNRRKNGNRIIRAMLTFDPQQEYSRKDLMERAGLNENQFKQAVDDSPVLKALLDKTRILNRRKYKNALNELLVDPKLVEKIQALLDAPVEETEEKETEESTPEQPGERPAAEDNIIWIDEWLEAPDDDEADDDGDDGDN